MALTHNGTKAKNILDVEVRGLDGDKCKLNFTFFYSLHLCCMIWMFINLNFFSFFEFSLAPEKPSD